MILCVVVAVSCCEAYALLRHSWIRKCRVRQRLPALASAKLLSNANKQDAGSSCVIASSRKLQAGILGKHKQVPAVTAKGFLCARTYESCLRRYQSDASDEFYDCQPDNGNLRHSQSADVGIATAATPAATVAPPRPQQSAPGDLSWIQCVIFCSVH